MKALIFLVFIGAIIGIGVMIGRGPTGNVPALVSGTPHLSNADVTPNPALPTSSAQPTPAQGGGVPTGSLFVLSPVAGGNEIVTINTETKAKRTIFSDKNAKQKIKLASSVTLNGDSLILLLSESDSPSGQLVAVSTNGEAKQTVLASNFVATEAPAISPDKKQLALVSFSNAEPNVGFSLVLMNIDGSNHKSLTTDGSGISHPVFSPDGKQIAFLKGATANSSIVATVGVDGGKVTTLYQAKSKIIEDFSWSTTGLLAITAAPANKKANSQSEVYLVDTKNQNISQATKNSLFERTPLLAPDASGLAYIQVAADKALDLTKSGEVIVSAPSGQNPVNIGTGTVLLGWIK